jgi:hypothetical protein
MHPLARIAPFALAGLALSLIACGAAELDDHSLKIEDATLQHEDLIKPGAVRIRFLIA